MRKQFEQKDPNSCLNKSQNNEMLFVLRSHDKAAPTAIRFWAMWRILIGKNANQDPEIKEALAVADIMERER